MTDTDEVKSGKAAERERRDAEIEARAADAYERIYRQQNHWRDWMYLADGLVLGRRWALEKAGTNVPSGRGYNMAFGRWMATRPWARDLDPPTRNDLFWCAEHRSDIEAWRDELAEQLGEGQRQKKNHPTHMKRAYMAAHKPEKEEEGDEAEGEEKPKKGTPDEAKLRAENTELRTQIAKLRANPFPWWDGAATEGARSLYEDRGDGRRGDGKARALLLALVTEFKARFANQTAQLLDEIATILRGPSEPTDVKALVDATNEQAKAERKTARAIARAGRGRKALAKVEG